MLCHQRLFGRTEQFLRHHCGHPDGGVWRVGIFHGFQFGDAGGIWAQLGAYSIAGGRDADAVNDAVAGVFASLRAARFLSVLFAVGSADSATNVFGIRREIQAASPSV